MGPVRSLDCGMYTVNDTVVQITELVWADGGRSFEVWRVSDEADLTSNECFDEFPTDEQIAAVLDAYNSRQVMN